MGLPVGLPLAGLGVCWRPSGRGCLAQHSPRRLRGDEHHPRTPNRSADCYETEVHTQPGAAPVPFLWFTEVAAHPATTGATRACLCCDSIGAWGWRGPDLRRFRRPPPHERINSGNQYRTRKRSLDSDG